MKREAARDAKEQLKRNGRVASRRKGNGNRQRRVTTSARRRRRRRAFFFFCSMNSARRNDRKKNGRRKRKATTPGCCCCCVFFGARVVGEMARHIRTAAAPGRTNIHDGVQRNRLTCSSLVYRMLHCVTCDVYRTNVYRRLTRMTHIPDE